MKQYKILSHFVKSEKLKGKNGDVNYVQSFPPLGVKDFSCWYIL